MRPEAQSDRLYSGMANTRASGRRRKRHSTAVVSCSSSPGPMPCPFSSRTRVVTSFAWARCQRPVDSATERASSTLGARTALE